MGTQEIFLKTFLYPIYVKKNRLKEILKEISDNQWKNIEEIETLQKIKIEKLLKHCFNNVPYYNKLFKKVGLFEKNLSDYNNFKKIPFLTKDLIRNNIDELIAKKNKNLGLTKNSTSGSTGETLTFYSDDLSLLYRKAQIIINRKWTKTDWGDPVARLWGAQIDIAKTMKLKNEIKNGLLNNLILSSFELSEKTMEIYTTRIKKFKPKLLISYPGPLEVFAEYIKSKSIIFTSLVAIITSAEQLFDYQRELFKNVFKVPVFNRYGSREVGDIAHECFIHYGLHLNADRIYIEILDDFGKAVSPGNVGELYITDLTNYGMPFIRYKICDRAAWSDIINCPCGRGLPMIKNLEGRSLDIIKTPNNKKLGGTFWTLLMRSKPGIKKFQVYQDEIYGIKLLYVPDEKFNENILYHYENKIKNICGQNFYVNFVKKKNIVPTLSGKHRIIISEC